MSYRKKKKSLIRWHDVLEYAIGEVGIKPEEFWRMTFAEVEAACKGYEVRLARSRELDRFIASVLINANRKRGAKVIRPTDIMPLITDRKSKKVELLTAEEYSKLLNLKVQWQNPN